MGSDSRYCERRSPSCHPRMVQSAALGEPRLRRGIQHWIPAFAGMTRKGALRLLTMTRTFLEMIKFEHSVFALPFAYLGLFLAEEGRPRGSLFLWVTLAMVGFRTMGMALNRLIDVEIDSLNPRTETRALPAKKISVPFVWGVTLVSCLLFEYTAYRLGPLCFQLSPIPVVLTVLYPFAKRFTWLSHGVLGIIAGIAPYGAWLAGRPVFSWIPGFLMLGVLFWVAGFDIIYATQDVEFDRSHRLYSIPARFGVRFSLGLTRVLHLLTLAAWALAGYAADSGFFYYLGILIAGIFLIREHWLVGSSGLKKLNEAFFTMNAVTGLSVFLAAVLDLTVRGMVHS